MDKLNEIKVVENIKENKWKIEIVEMGDPYFCMLSFFLPPIASAYTKYYFDNTPICFSLLFSNHINNRRDIRLAYKLSGNDFDDVFTSIFCSCCAINQVYNTYN